MNEDIKKYNAVIQFKIKQADTFCVEIKAWVLNDKWMWNVYANIYEKHSLFNKPNQAYECLPFHGGCTFDSLITHENSGADTYKEDSKNTTLKLGSDYMHLHDALARRTLPVAVGVQCAAREFRSEGHALPIIAELVAVAVGVANAFDTLTLEANVGPTRTVAVGLTIGRG